MMQYVHNKIWSAYETRTFYNFSKHSTLCVYYKNKNRRRKYRDGINKEISPQLNFIVIARLHKIDVHCGDVSLYQLPPLFPCFLLQPSLSRLLVLLRMRNRDLQCNYATVHAHLERDWVKVHYNNDKFLKFSQTRPGEIRYEL